MEEKDYIERFNAMGIPGMGRIEKLHALPGSYINLEYTLPSGQKVKLWDDKKTYLAAEICKAGSDRCYGLTAGDGLLLVCEYGAEGADPEIVTLERL